ncbi:chromate efflux transporter, partial [Xanthovirga aplysinae]|uniref:chromate efflux transporter n=1 Tax=Xanthovirga aplysinae TaxID=2529853 RepID=UPI0012BD78F8
KELTSLFFKLGVIAFGGPAAHIAILEEKVVHKRKWLSRQHFLDLVGATNLIPGPNSTQMTMHVGKEVAGTIGLLVAGISFIFPAALITLVFAILYVNYGNLPNIEPFLFGIKPAILAVICGAIYKLGKKAVKGWFLGTLGVAVIALSLMGINEVLLIIGSGLLGMIVNWSKETQKFDTKLKSVSPFGLGSIFAIQGLSNFNLFWVFFKISLVLFGSGYLLIAYLDAELVERLAWISRTQLLDAIAIGQLTPGPILTTATFIGYQISGLSGATLATLGIFIPSFFLVNLLNPIVPRLRKTKAASSFLDAINVGAVGIMIAVTLQLGQSVLTDWRAWFITALSLVITFGPKKINVLWLVFGSAFLGYILQLF